MSREHLKQTNVPGDDQLSKQPRAGSDLGREQLCKQWGNRVTEGSDLLKIPGILETTFVRYKIGIKKADVIRVFNWCFSMRPQEYSHFALNCNGLETRVPIKSIAIGTTRKLLLKSA